MPATFADVAKAEEVQRVIDATLAAAGWLVEPGNAEAAQLLDAATA